MKPVIKYPEDPVFYERYAFFRNYGYGCMLVYWTGRTLEYVRFSPEDFYQRDTIISSDLFLKYKKEMAQQKAEDSSTI